MSSGEPGPGLSAAVWRGGRRSCPNCGEGPLFEGWLNVRTNCSECDTLLLEDQGDPWAFVVLLDRVFVLLLLGVVYFRFGPPTTGWLIAVFVGLTAAFVATTPHRFGVCLAVAYWLRHRGESA